jgi:methyl-accepting chemotaxis protein
MIERVFIIKFLLKFTCSVIAGLFIILLSIFLVIPNKNVLHYYEAISAFININKTLFNTFLIAGAIELVFIIIVVHIVSIFASHKFAGPLYRLEKIIEDISDGKLKQTVRFRKYDPLREVEDACNNSINELTGNIKAISKAFEEMNKSKEELDGTEGSISKFKERISALETEIEKFKI